jgi:hypothetical protein
MTPNDGVTCPVILTRDPVSKDIRPRPYEGGSAAIAGSGLRGVGWLFHPKIMTWLISSSFFFIFVAFKTIWPLNADSVKKYQNKRFYA